MVTADRVMVTNVPVTLASSDPGELTVPPVVTITAGQSNTVFDLTVGDDAIPDGSQDVELSAQVLVPDLGIARAVVAVHDSETLVLSVDLPVGATEGDGTLTASAAVQFGEAVPEPVRIWLRSGDTTEVTVAESIVMPAGETNTGFEVTVVDDGEIDGSQEVVVSAHVENWTDGLDSMVVADNEHTNLMVTLPAWLGEGDGLLVGAGVVGVDGTVEDDVVVALASDDTTELSLPSDVTIQAGATSAVFDITVMDDDLYDGVQTVAVNVAAIEFSPGDALATVADNEILGITFDPLEGQTSGVPFDVSLWICDTNGEPAAYTGTVQLAAVCSTGSVSLVPAIAGPFEGGHWSGLVLLRGASSNTWVTADDLDGHTGQSLPFALDAQLPTEVFDPSPPDLSTWISQDSDLAWKAWRRGVLINGGFESGDLSGWRTGTSGSRGFVINDGTVNPASADGALPPYVGDFSLLSDLAVPATCFVYQEVAIPHDATSVTLSWADRIRNHRSHYLEPHQEFRVELWDAASNVLTEVFSTDPGDPLLNNWKTRNVDLSAHIGQRFHVAFVVQNTQYPLNVHLDDIRVTTDVDDATVFDVYVGNEPELDVDALQGTTDAASWDLPDMPPLVDRYWKIVSRSGGEQTTNPVWRFTTAGLDHFTWGAVASPQTSRRPFEVVLTARGTASEVLTGFAEEVAVSAWGLKSRDSAIAISEIRIGSPDAVEFTNVSTGSVGIAGWEVFIYDRYPGEWPSPTFSFTFPLGSVSEAGSVFVMEGAGTVPGAYPLFKAGAEIQWAVGAKLAVLLLDGGGAVADFVCASDADPRAFTEPLVITPAEWAGSPVPGGAVLQRYGNSDNGIAADWRVTDQADIGTLNAGLVLPFEQGVCEIPVAPTNAGPFVSGVWTGTVSVREPAEAVFLRGDHSRGAFGLSDSFEVLPRPVPRHLMLLIK